MLGDSCLNNLDTGTKGTSDLVIQALSSVATNNLTIIHADDTDSGTCVCAFKLRNEVIDQESIILTVAPSERNYECVQLMIYIRILLWMYPFNMFLLFTSLFARLFWWFFVAYK